MIIIIVIAKICPNQEFCLIKMKKFISKENRNLLTILTLMWAMALLCYPAGMASAVSLPSNWEGIKLEILAQIDLSHKTYLTKKGRHVNRPIDQFT